MKWDDFDFWNAGEYQVIEERLDEMDEKGILYNPQRENLFAAMDIVDFDDVSVAILGQDPYPDPQFATGIAFSIPPSKKVFPPTLINIFKELDSDLHIGEFDTGDLTPWCEQGVFLWNVVPICLSYKPASLRDWCEWEFLNKEIVFRLSQKGGVVFVSLGGLARLYLEEVDSLSYSHPSPLGAKKGSNPFLGSRLFSTINAKLVEMKKPIIDWRL